MIKVQSEDFSVEKETKILLDKNHNVGAISSFIGIVRDKAKEKVFHEVGRIKQIYSNKKKTCKKF